ncbi:MAG: hypothetical protein K2I87_07120 [Bacteroidales bacterium]|nr:hypothetical protein [Bacteroidales bacterium]
MQRFKKPEFWAYPILMVGLWAFFAFAMPDVLEFWEKNQLFRFSSDYWHFFDHEPFGTLIYVHTFLIQFSYYPWLGAIVYALLFTLTAWLFNRCVATNGNRRLLPGLLSVALLLPTSANFGLLVLLVVFLAVVGAHCWIYWKNRILRYSCQVIVLAGLTYLVREYMVWILPFYMCLDWGRTRQNGQKFNPLFLLIPLGGTMLAWGLEAWFCAPYEFISSKSPFKFTGNAFSPSSNIPFNYFRPKKIVFVCMEIATFFSLAGVFYPFFKKKLDWIGGLFLIGGVLWITPIQVKSIADFQQVDRLCRNYQWENALRKLDSQWEKFPVITSLSDFTNTHRLFFGHTKIALLATRKATNKLFTYPQPAFPLLFPLAMNNRAECFVLPSYYTFVGEFSESLHLNYDLITCHCISATILNATIISSLIVDDTLPAFKLTHFLEKSLFYRHQASVYKDSFQRNNLPAIKRGKQMLPFYDYAVASYIPDKNAVKQHMQQQGNPYFYEYFISLCLLDKNTKTIVDEHSNIKKFYQKGKPFFAPYHIQEAILASFNYSPSRYLYPQKIEGISSDVWNDYWLFIIDNQSYFNGSTTFSELQKKWGHTYWFYDCYLTMVDMESKTSQSIN